jgi:hypothetical protein
MEFIQTLLFEKYFFHYNVLLILIFDNIYEEEISNTVFILVCGLFFMYGQKGIGGIPSS